MSSRRPFESHIRDYICNFKKVLTESCFLLDIFNKKSANYFNLDMGCRYILRPTMTRRDEISFTEEEKKKSLQFYDRIGSIAMVIHNFGY